MAGLTRKKQEGDDISCDQCYICLNHHRSRGQNKFESPFLLEKEKQDIFIPAEHERLGEIPLACHKKNVKVEKIDLLDSTLTS